MNILLPVIDFSRSGGARVLAELATYWTKLGHSVTFLVHQSSPLPYFPTIAKTIWLNNRGQPIPVDSRSSSPASQRVLNRLNALRLGIDNVKEEYDVILANNALTAWPIYFSRTRALRFYYVQAYEPDFWLDNSIASRVKYLLSTGSYYLGFKRIVNSPIYFSFRHLKSHHFVPPGLDLSIMHPKENGGSQLSSPVVIGCIGRKEKWKGTGLVIDAFRELKKRDKNVQLCVAYGNVPNDTIDELGIEIVVPENDRELSNYYRSLDILVAPGTIQHGAPHYPVMEAMACGIPVITTGYMPASIEANNAWLVPNYHVSAIADAVEEIIDAPLLRKLRVENGLESVKQFSWGSVAQKMISIFEEELQQRNKDSSK